MVRRGSSLQWYLTVRQREANKTSPEKVLRVHFAGEDGIDTGAMAKEFLSSAVYYIRKEVFPGGVPTDCCTLIKDSFAFVDTFVGLVFFCMGTGTRDNVKPRPLLVTNPAGAIQRVSEGQGRTVELCLDGCSCAVLNLKVIFSSNRSLRLSLDWRPVRAHSRGPATSEQLRSTRPRTLYAPIKERKPFTLWEEGLKRRRRCCWGYLTGYLVTTSSRGWWWISGKWWFC